MDVEIDWMIRSDMEDVLRIEKSCFEFPWKEEDFIMCLRQHYSIGMVARVGKEIAGFMVFHLFKGGIQLLNLAVRPDARRRSIGKCMVQKLIGKLVLSDTRNRINLEVRETNLRAQQFFKSQGFVAEGVFRDWYNDCNEDAYSFVYRHGVPEKDLRRAENRISRLMENK